MEFDDILRMIIVRENIVIGKKYVEKLSFGNYSFFRLRPDSLFRAQYVEVGRARMPHARQFAAGEHWGSQHIEMKLVLGDIFDRQLHADEISAPPGML